MSEITLTQTQEFIDFLTEHKLPENMRIRKVKITHKKAMSILYYLQEVLHLFPDHFEMCCVCNRMFNSENEGGIYKAGWKCDNCRNYNKEEIE